MDIDVNISDIVLETNRLILRPWYDADLDDFYEYASVNGVGEMAGWKHHESKEESYHILHNFITLKSILAIVYKEHNKCIGSLGIHKSWANDIELFKNLKVKEIGYVLSKHYWGYGIMPEAVAAGLEFCFHDLQLDAVTCTHNIKNNQSRRVIEKSGFQIIEKTSLQTLQTPPDQHSLYYILIRPAYDQKSEPKLSGKNHRSSFTPFF